MWHIVYTIMVVLPLHAFKPLSLWREPWLVALILEKLFQEASVTDYEMLLTWICDDGCFWGLLLFSVLASLGAFGSGLMPLKFHSALPAAALEYFSESCVQDAMRHPGRGSSHALPMSALDLFSTSALQHFWRSTGGHLGAITLSALELFEGSQVQQAVEDERASFLLTPPELPQGQAAAVQRVAASSDPHEDPQPTPLRTESSLRRALSTMTFGLMFSDHPIAAVAPSKQPKSDAQAPTPQVTARPETPLPTSYTAAPVLAAEGSTLSSSGVSFVPGFPFIPGVLYSSSPILAAVQPAEQPLTDPIFADRVPNCTPIDPTTSQEGIAEAEDTSASALDFAAGGASPTSSSEVKGILESNSSSLADAMQQADKAALDQTPQAAKPKGLRRMTSSVKGFTIKAFRKSKDIDLSEAVQEQQAAAPVDLPVPEKKSMRQKAKRLTGRIMPAALGGSPWM